MPHLGNEVLGLDPADYLHVDNTGRVGGGTTAAHPALLGSGGGGSS